MAGAVFVTGASGFLGSRLVTLLARSGRRVVCMGRSTPPGQGPGIECIAGDLLDGATYRKALGGCAAVVHLAAATGKHPPAEYFRVNRDGTGTLVDEAQQAGVRRLLFISTIAVKFADLSRYYYAQSKRQAEEIVAGSGLDWTTIRPTMIFGNGSAVFEGLRRLASLPVLPVFGSGRALVQPVFVDDLSVAIAAILDEPASYGRTIEIGGPEVLTIEELLLRIRHSAGISNSRRIHLPAGLMATCLGLVEPILRPLLPVTAGQLASFTNDGTASTGLPAGSGRHGMRDIEAMLCF
jgi:nucleoside-diphosphate-sugar epimerase